MLAEALRSFCLAARLGSVTAAGRELGLSQPAVSRHLRSLQEAYGAPLYRRDGRGIALTPAGRRLLPYACSASAALARAQAVLDGRVEEGATHLRFGLSHHLTTRYTGALLRGTKRFGDLGNLLRLHLLEGYTGELVRGLREGALDAAYVLGEVSGADDLGPRRVGAEPVVLLVRDDDPLGEDPKLPLAALEGETLVLPSSASSVFRIATERLAAAGVRPGRTLEVSGPAAVRSAVYDGLGIGITIESFVQGQAVAGTLRTVRTEPEVTADVTRLTRDASFLFPEQQRASSFLAMHLHEPDPVADADA